MTFQTALTNTQLNILRGSGAATRSWAADQRIIVCPNTTVLAARVNGTVTGTFASFTYNNGTSGAGTSAELNQTILISHTNSAKDYYARLRVRKACTGTTSGTIYCNETSVNLTDQDYVFIIDHYDATDKLARPVGDPPVQYKDYDLPYEQQAPVVVGLQTAYGGASNATTGKFRIAFDVSSSYATEPGATISSYQFTFKASTYTVVSGALNTSTVTVDFNANTWQWGKLVVTDSNGVAWTRRFSIGVDGFTDGFEGAKITGDLTQGWTATVTGFTGLSSVINGTFCIICRSTEYYNGTAQTAVGSSVDFCGWLRNENNRGESDPLYSFSSEVEFEIMGIGAAMARLEMLILALRTSSSPAVWDELKTLNPRRAIIHILQRHSTILNLCDFTADITDDRYIFPYLSTQGGNLLTAANGIAAQINSALEFAPDGRIQLTRNAWHLTGSQRSALTVIANWTNTDFTAISEPVYHWDTVGAIDADGAVYNQISGQVTAFRSRAPGYAQGSAEGRATLNNQILETSTDNNSAQSELNQRSGDEYSVQNPNIEITTSMMDGYYFGIPSMGQVYEWTLTGTENIRGLTYNTSSLWVVTKVDYTHDNKTGSRSTEWTYRLVPPVGDPGDTVPIIPDGQIDLALPDLPPFPAFPDLPEFNIPEVGLTNDQVTPAQLPQGIQTNGNGVLIATASQTHITNTFVTLTNPNWYEDTVSSIGSFAYKQAIFDPFYSPYSKPSVVGAFWLLTDGTNSKIINTTNVFSTPATLNVGANFSGVYDSIKPCSTQDEIVVYATSDASTWTHISDFTAGTDGWILPGDGLGGGGVYSAGVGFVSTCASNNYNHVVLANTFTAANITDIKVYITYDPGAPTGPGNTVIYTYLSGVQTLRASTGGTPANPFEYAGSITIDAIAIDIKASNPCAANCTVTKIEVSGSGTNPFSSGSGNAAIRTSIDRGTTVSSSTMVGNSPGAIGGFDVIQAGTVIMAAADKQVKISTSISSPSFSNAAGGTLSTYQPVLIKIPRRKWAGGDNINISAPDYLLGASGVESSHCLWKVTGAGTKTGITPAGVTAMTGPECAAVWWQNSNYMAVLGSVSGTTHLFTTTNGGTSWTDRGAFAGATHVKMRAGPNSQLQLFIGGGTILKYSKTGGTSTANRTKPTSNNIISVEVLG